MGANYVKLASTYLRLWKLIDIHFPGHHWLEITEESEKVLKDEIYKTLKGDLSWAPESGALREDISQTLELVESKVETDWILRAQKMRTGMQDKALKAVDQIREDSFVLHIEKN
jgi:hypothetical protein